ncbi:unnamed protein product [Rotaria magnacalcarata]|uniref:Cytochrome c oxidase subunit 4 n=1 Tax=Rotaria magnacalcarata TaxID=392030 RepID=A0A818X7X4_9BILA|nr:unnamed protein product [Rotaria magnacalcarata]CAF3735266.1 unnamed protein product [Rotaria magnacalcarata]CAF5014083.1 unnamed protein product [Rotaria magnacalcarata]CAF5070935.1 unnamed protein product [Rotaria magnacalcarata]
MNGFVVRHAKLTQPQAALLIRQECRKEASISSSVTLVHSSPLVLDNTKSPKANTVALAELRKKGNVDWQQLSVEEKKGLYRASFRQTFAEFTVPTGLCKWAIGWSLIALSGLVLTYDGWRHVGMKILFNEFIFSKSFDLFIRAYSFDKPDSLTDEKLKTQLQYDIAARQGPM